MWNDLKIILIVLLFFILSFLVLLLIIANPQLTYVILIATIFLCVLLRIIAKIIFNITSKVISKIKYSQEIKQRENISKEKHLKREQWVNDFRSGKKVKIGETVIQYENNTLIINGDSNPVENIQELEFTNKILRVWKNKLDTKDFVIDYDSLITKVLNPNWGKVTSTTRMTEEEYYNDIKYNTAFDFCTYDFDKAYYISITLYDGKKKNYLIGNCYCYLEPYLNTQGYNFSKENAELFEKMFKEVKGYIFKSEEEKKNLLQWINNLKNGNTVIIGETTIQYKNNTLVINENSIFVKEIQNLEFTEKVSSIWKNTLDINPYKDDYYSVENPNWGKTIHREKITLEQYNFENSSTLATAEEAIKNNQVSADILKYNYEFENGYYLSITLKNGQQKNYLIGNSVKHYEENQKLKEKLKEMINELKFILF